MNHDHWQWRWTSTWGRVFGIIDVRTLLPFVLFAVHMRWWTFKLVVGCAAFFTLLQFMRIRPEVLLWRLYWGVWGMMGGPVIRARRGLHRGNLP